MTFIGSSIAIIISGCRPILRHFDDLLIMGKYADSFKGFYFETKKKKNKSRANYLMLLYFTDLEGREVSLYLACHDRNAFSTSTNQRRYKLWSC